MRLESSTPAELWFSITDVLLGCCCAPLTATASLSSSEYPPPLPKAAFVAVSTRADQSILWLSGSGIEMAELPSAAEEEDVAVVGATEAGTAGRSFRPCGDDVERLLSANKLEEIIENKKFCVV